MPIAGAGLAIQWAGLALEARYMLLDNESHETMLPACDFQTGIGMVGWLSPVTCTRVFEQNVALISLSCACFLLGYEQSLWPLAFNKV